METIPIFEDDIVELIYQCKKNGTIKRKVGTILESSQNISSDEEDEDDSMYQSLRKNTVRVAWHPSGKTEVIEEAKLNILERSLLPGDIVTKLATGKESQKGYVTNCKMSCVLQCLTQPFIVFDVDSSLLSDFLPFRSEHQQVYMDGWVGSVDKISERVVLKFPDGARCHLFTDELIGNLTEFCDVNDKRDKSSEFFTNSFYVGQLLRGQFGLLDGCSWLEQTKSYSSKSIRRNKNKTVIVCVEELEVSSVDVMWMCRGYSEAVAGEEINKHPPAIISGQDLERLKVLDYFEACDYALGSKAYYNVRKDDHIIPSSGTNKDDIRNEFISKFHAKKLAVQEKPSLQNTEPESDCLSSLSKVSTNSEGNSNISLPTNIKHELHEANLSNTPGKIVCASRKSEVLATNRSQTSVCSYGKKHKHQRVNSNKPAKKKRIIQKVNFGHFGKKLETLDAGTRVPVEVIALHSNVEVLWQDGIRESNISSGDLLPVQYVDDLEFFPGDYVSPARPMEHLSPNCYGLIQKVNHLERTCIVQWYNNTNSLTALNGSSSFTSLEIKEEVSVFDIKEHSDLKFRPGAVVVRVGGFEDDQSCGGSNSRSIQDIFPAVGGQVLESGVDGKLLVHWADGNRTYCRPVDLFLITSDISDLESSEDESEYDSDDSETDKFSSKSAASWEWETEEEVEDEEEISLCGDEPCDSIADKLKMDKESSIKDMDLNTLERNISLFMAMKETLEQHQLTLESILGQEKIEEPPKLASNQEVHIGCIASAKVTEDSQMLPEGACDFDGFMAVVLDVSNLYRTMHRLDNVKLISTWSTMKKYLEAVQDQMKKAKNYNLCRKTFAKAKQSFEINSKMSTEVHFKDKQDSYLNEVEDETNTPEKGSQILSISSLFKVFDIIQPEKTPYDIIRTFHAFIKSLLSEFEECRELCFCALQTKLKQDEIPYDEAPLCDDSFSAQISPVESEQMSREMVKGTDNSKEEVISGGSDALLSHVETKSDFLGQGFMMMETVPESHHFKRNNFTPVNPKTFFSSIRKETVILKTCLPKGIHVRGFESRMDLFSCMIEGPSNTPYEDGLFFFDVQLSPDYPKSPPKLHYISYCSDRLNPNLYEDGKVCVSLLGTWSGRGTEIWNPMESNLLQILVSIQGLILNPEPYYNEAGYEKQKGTNLGAENCRMYNEMAIIKLVQAMTNLVLNPCDVFAKEIASHMLLNSEKFVTRLKSWTKYSVDPSSPESKNQIGTSVDIQKEPELPLSYSTAVSMDLHKKCPEFPLFPASKGFKMTLAKCLDQFIISATSMNMFADANHSSSKEKTL